MLDVRRLRLLRELSHYGTIAATATACSLTPSAVSQQLSLLEREVGAPLLVRDGRRVMLTEAARVLVEHTERILADLEHAEADVAGLTGGVRGEARIAAFPTAASALAAPAIALCNAAHPDLRTTLSETEAPDAIAGVRSGHVDVALVYEYNLLASTTVPGVELVELLSEPLLAALPADGIPDSDRIDLDDLREHRWIAPHSDTSLRGAIERACGLSGFAPRLDYTSDDYTVILALVGAGLGVALIPRLAVESIAAEVRLLPVTRPELSRTVSAAIRAGSRTNPVVATVLDALVTTAGRLSS